MGREERKLRRFFQERARRERKLARQYSQFTNERDAAADLSEDGSSGLVTGIGPGCCEVLDGDARLLCRTALDVAPGDRIVYSRERLKINRVLPRRTLLSRPDPHNPRIERVIAANVDVVVVVVSVKSPPLRPGLIDRYLIAIERSGAGPLLCVNKIDLGGYSELAPYYELGIPIVTCSAATGEGIGPLGDALAGKTCVLAGHSGVGKRRSSMRWRRNCGCGRAKSVSFIKAATPPLRPHCINSPIARRSSIPRASGSSVCGA